MPSIRDGSLPALGDIVLQTYAARPGANDVLAPFGLPRQDRFAQLDVLPVDVDRGVLGRSPHLMASHVMNPMNALLMP